jgi:cytochrome c biogenesis protein CcmG/thiol:disulfide interchange protein DsbE
VEAAPPDTDRLRRRLSRWLGGAALALTAMLALLGLGARGSATNPTGAPAPAFDLPLLAGGRVTNADLAGRVAVINVWASWCPPCREEAPALQRVAADADPARVAFLGVAHSDTAGDARSFVQRFAVPYPNALDDDSFGRAYGVTGLPMTFIVGADGTLLDRNFGPIGEARLRALIADALARTAGGS